MNDGSRSRPPKRPYGKKVTPAFIKWMRTGLENEFMSDRYGIDRRVIPKTQLRAAMRAKLIRSHYGWLTKNNGLQVRGVRFSLTTKGREWLKSGKRSFK